MQTERARSLRLVLSFFVFGTVLVGIGQTKAIPLEDICVKVSGSAKSEVSPRKLFQALFKDIGVPNNLDIFDADGDGNVSEAERIAVLLNESYCEGPGAARCGVGDSTKLSVARDVLHDFPSTENVSFERRSYPTAAAVKAQPWLKSHSSIRSDFYMGELLSPGGEYVRMTCSILPGQLAKANPTRPSDGLAQLKPKTPLERLRVTGKIDGLSLPRKDLKSIPEATISFQDDRENSKRTLQADIFVGYDVGSSDDEQIIPFVGYNRLHVRDTSNPSAASTGDDVDKWTVGLLANISVDDNSLAFSTMYVIDSAHDSDIANVRLSWIPAFLRWGDSPFGRAWFTPNRGAAFTMFGDFLVTGSYVIDAGSNRDLFGTSDYFRIGGEIGARFVVLEPDFLSGISADVSYKYLQRLTGGPDHISWLEVGASIPLGGSDRVTLRGSYQKGKDEETLVHTDTWKISIGVRY